MVLYRGEYFDRLNIRTSLFECEGNITGSQSLSNLFISSGQNMSGFSVGNEVRIVLLSFLRNKV